MSLGLTECILLDNEVFLSIHSMRVDDISPFNHLKCIIGVKYSLRFEFPLSRYCINCKMQRKSGIPYKCQQPKLVERLVLWYVLDCDGKSCEASYKEKYSHTIITERYRFCCFNLSLSKYTVNNGHLFKMVTCLERPIRSTPYSFDYFMTLLTAVTFSTRPPKRIV